MTIGLTFSCSPTGPPSATRNIYTIPQTTTEPDEFAYVATFHPEISRGGLVTSCNVDSPDGLSALEPDDHRYQPQFVVIGG